MEFKTKFDIGDSVYAETFEEEDVIFEGKPTKVKIKRKRGPFFINAVEVKCEEMFSYKSETYHLADAKSLLNAVKKLYYVSVQDLTKA